jgi:tetratricopeptide (TPR) repeat protein
LKGPEVDKITDLTLIALARVFYTIGDYKKALKYYNRIPQDSPYWLDSMFELSWAYYQLGQYPRALGNLETLHSPYFSNEYYPEAFVLKAVILFMNCHYKEAIETINQSYKEYWNVLQELKRVLKKYREPGEFYRYLARISTKGAKYSMKFKRIFNAALADKKVRHNFEYVMLVNKEYKQLQALSADPVAKRLVEILLPDIVAFRELSTEKAGRLARDRMKRVFKDLRHVMAEALKVRFECNNALAGRLSMDLRAAQIKASDKGGVKLDPEHRRWPFDGEYWKDELGSYYYPIRSYCK